MSSIGGDSGADLIEIDNQEGHQEEEEVVQVVVEQVEEEEKVDQVDHQEKEQDQEVVDQVEDEEDQIDIDDEEDIENEGDERVLTAQLPTSRVRRLMKIDCDHLINKEALFLTSIAAELFISLVAQNSGKITVQNKKKTLSFQHLKTAISEIPALDFLEGSIPGVDL